MWSNVLHTRNMWFNSMWYNNHMLCNSVWNTIISYVTGVLYNVLCVLFTPLAAIFRGLDVPAAQEPPLSLSLGLAWMNIIWLLWACGQTGYSYMVACCIAAAALKLQLQVDDWETWSRRLASQSKRPGMGVVCPHGLYAELQKTQRRDTGQGRPPSLWLSLSASGPDLSQKSESKNRPESQSKKLRNKN